MTKILSFNPICVLCVSASFIIWQRCAKKKRDNWKAVFFNPLRQHRNCRVYNTKCSTADCCFLKTEEIVVCLQNATKSIDVCVFAISNEQISISLIQALKRGIVIRIIVSNCILIHGKEIKKFRRNGIEIKCQNDNNCFMHNKFCLVDSIWLIHSSMNWTHQATNTNWENFIITDSPCLISEFSSAFEYIWLNTNKVNEH